MAIVEAKDNTHGVSDGLQQALRYAEILELPTAFSSNGDGFAQHNRALLGLCLDEQEARWKRKEHVMPVVRYESESDVDTPFLRGLVELKVIHRRQQGFVMLECWIVEEAVKRLDRELTEAEQIAVVRATTNPRKVDWPGWWLPHLREKAPRGPVKISFHAMSGW